jgi:vacuolar-type H+-ATPase catalytic subunit A/Vma1
MEKLACDTPLVTGIRVLDAMFPLALGGTCIFPSAFGCSQGTITQTLAKYSNVEAMFYIDCGGRSNETSEILDYFPQLTIIRCGKEVSIMERTALVTNTSNMSPAAQ